jgi:hypothetical protein
MQHLRSVVSNVGRKTGDRRNRGWEIGAPFCIPLGPSGECAKLIADSEQPDNRSYSRSTPDALTIC